MHESWIRSVERIRKYVVFINIYGSLRPATGEVAGTKQNPTSSRIAWRIHFRCRQSPENRGFSTTPTALWATMAWVSIAEKSLDFAPHRVRKPRHTVGVKPAE
jgi:hypothetical protein